MPDTDRERGCNVAMRPTWSRKLIHIRSGTAPHTTVAGESCGCPQPGTGTWESLGDLPGKLCGNQVEDSKSTAD